MIVPDLGPRFTARFHAMGLVFFEMQIADGLLLKSTFWFETPVRAQKFTGIFPNRLRNPGGGQNTFPCEEGGIQGVPFKPRSP